MRPEDIDIFDNYVKSHKVNITKKDRAKAKNLFSRAMTKFNNIEKMGITKVTATDYCENIYESCKMLIQAFMALDGFNPYSHEATIAFAFDKLNLGLEKTNKLNKFRKLSNDISYRGGIATIKEAEEIKLLFQSLKNKLQDKFKKNIDVY